MTNTRRSFFAAAFGGLVFAQQKRDMIVRSRLQPDRALALNRTFQEYLHAFGELQKLVKPVLEELAKTGKK